MKCAIKCCCGHTYIYDFEGTAEEREQKIKYYEENVLCPDCFQKEMNLKRAEGCKEVEMRYKEYKSMYPTCEIKEGTYDKSNKRIVVYVPEEKKYVGREEKMEEKRSVTGGTKNHHNYEKIWIGSSDIAKLTLIGESGNIEMYFGGDDSYKAYMVDENAKIPDHYKEIAEFDNWMGIKDDAGVQLRIEAKEIRVFRAADFGCIIQKISE